MVAQLPAHLLDAVIDRLKEDPATPERCGLDLDYAERNI